MKYIRTKNGIFEVVKEDGDWLEIISNFERKMQCHCVIKKHAIIKQADTIGELCDEFVGVDIETKTGCVGGSYSELDKIKAEMEHYDFQIGKDYEIYGAIWTDRGLIYVAKTNEKGGLELL